MRVRSSGFPNAEAARRKANDEEELRVRRKAWRARDRVRVVRRVPGPFGNSLTALNCNCSVRRIPSGLPGARQKAGFRC